jgi:uncharacterized cupin superfamily protein
MNHKITHIAQSAGTRDLQDGGVMPTASHGTTPQSSARSLSVPGIDGATTGIWECSAGRWRRASSSAEIMHFLAGECIFTPDGGSPMHLRAGDTVVFPVHTTGVWEATTTIRKVFVSLVAPL